VARWATGNLPAKRDNAQRKEINLTLHHASDSDVATDRLAQS
jgi:hypothetical protein